MRTTPLNRLLKTFLKQGLVIDLKDNLYSISHVNRPDSPIAEILLPTGFPLDKKAVHQLLAFASVKHPYGGQVQATYATPDIHPGSLVPVGSVVATTTDMVIPQAIGTDIHCGMRLHVIDLSYHQFIMKKEKLIESLRGDLLLGTRDLPMRSKDFKALFMHGLLGWFEEAHSQPLGQLKRSNFSQLLTEMEKIYDLGGLSGDIKWLPEHLLNEEREILRDSYLATIGGGNHFVEIQVIDEVLDKKTAFQWGIKQGNLAIMIHSGSRNVGIAVGNTWKDISKKKWPKGMPAPLSGIFPIRDPYAKEYLLAMNSAANYANLNRLLLAELVRLRFREAYSPDLEMPLIYDSPHNTITVEQGAYIHRKGATPAHEGQPVLIPGSMGHASYLMKGLGNKKYLQSASHGAGRAYSRNEVYHKHKQGIDIGLGCIECITLKEERKIEEAPLAYKAIDEVVEVQVKHEIVSAVAKLKPILTFKG